MSRPRPADDNGVSLAAELLRPLSRRARPGEDWLRLMTWKPAHVAADVAASASGERVGLLTPERDNPEDRNAVTVVCADGVIGYLPRWEAAHVARAVELLDAPPSVRLRRSGRKSSPLFDVLLPTLHTDGLRAGRCGACRAANDESRPGEREPRLRPGEVWSLPLAGHRRAPGAGY